MEQSSSVSSRERFKTELPFFKTRDSLLKILENEHTDTVIKCIAVPKMNRCGNVAIKADEAERKQRVRVHLEPSIPPTEQHLRQLIEDLLCETHAEPQHAVIDYYMNFWSKVEPREPPR